MSSAGCQCGKAPGACTTEFQYAVKLVCGNVKAPKGGQTPVAPGRYWTAVNIHNPDKCRDAHFRWKVVVAPTFNQATPATPVFQRPRTLRPDEAIEIDCQQAMAALPKPAPGFVKGYVVIESDIELDVVAVYTGSAGTASSTLNTFHTERVQARCIPVCDDLVLPLHTGVAGWQTIAPPPLGPVVVLSGLNTNWAAPPFGASWVSQLASDSNNASPGLRRYQLCFDLCFGFQPPASFQIQGLADDSAQVFLNGGLIGTIGGFGSLTTLNVTAAILQGPHGLRAGNNCFEVRVTNSAGKKNNPTGFALAGILTVLRGKCPCSRIPIAARPPGAVPIELDE